MATVLHFTKGMPSYFLLAFHRKEKHILWIFIKIPFKMYEMDAQYTGILCSTDTSTKLEISDEETKKFGHRGFFKG